MSQDLIAETTELLKGRKESQRAIAAATGLSQKWISLVENGEAKNPSYIGLTTLRDYLQKQAAKTARREAVQKPRDRAQA
jgi:transcriptional regulator with XRE-family HTH domain